MASETAQIVDRAPIRLHTVSPNATLEEAARKMREHNSHALLVRDRGAFVGIVTAEDIITKAVATAALTRDTEVARVMRPVEMSCSETDRPEKVAARMRQSGVSHLLVVDEEGEVLGLVSWEDLAWALIEDVIRS